MIDLAEAHRLIFRATPVLGLESVPIIGALSRVVAQDIVAAEDLPGSDISAMDGYAVRHASLRGASRQRPVRFRIIGEAPAGRPCSAAVGAGEAVRIMTGGLVPEGADTVVKSEKATEHGETVACCHDPGYGKGIRFKGNSLKEGQIVLRAGDVVTPLEVGALASMRRAYVYVHRKPMVAILSTGDELVDFHDPVSPGKAMCSNLYALAAQAVDAGAVPLCLGIVKDDLEAQHRMLREALHADVIVTSGGTSRGKYDFVHAAFASLGMKVRYTNVFAKPGKPTVFGTLERNLIFGLPGNPMAAMFSFEQFVKPALFKMMGHRDGAGYPAMTTAGNTISDALTSSDGSKGDDGKGNVHHLASQVPLNRRCLEPRHRIPDEQIRLPAVAL